MSARWLALAPLLAACRPSGGETGFMYCPLTVGSKWTYSLSGPKGTPASAENRAVRKEDVGFTECTVIETWMDGKMTSTEHLAATSDGIYRCSFNGERVSPAFRLLKFPYKKGDSWTVRYNVRGMGPLEVTVTVDDEELQLPVSRIKTYKSTCVARSRGQEVLSTTYWFGRMIGIVKQELTAQRTKVSISLQSHFLAAP
jgi:hypothetical protein